MMVKTWVLEKLEEERHFNRRENDLLKSDVHQSIHQAHFSRWSAVEHGWSVLNERGVNDLQGRVRDLERELAKLRRESHGLVEMERMIERMSSMEQQMAKMQEERVKERQEIAEKESERNLWMDREKERVRKEMEEELAKERREMAKMEKERKIKVERCILQLQEERTRQKREMENKMEDLRAETKRMERRQTAMERVVEGIEAWVRKRETAHLQKVEAVTDKLEDRMDQMEVSISSQQDCQFKTEMEALMDAKVAGLEKRLGNKFLDMADYIEKAVKNTTTRCLLKGVGTLMRHDDQSNTNLEDPVVARQSAYKGSVRGSKGGRRCGKRRQAREEHIPSSSESGSGYWSRSGSENGSGNGIGSRGSGSWSESERKSLRRRAVEVDSDISNAVCSESRSAASGVDASKTGSDLSVEGGMGDNNKRGFLERLFRKKKGKKA